MDYFLMDSEQQKYHHLKFSKESFLDTLLLFFNNWESKFQKYTLEEKENLKLVFNYQLRVLIDNYLQQFSYDYRTTLICEDFLDGYEHSTIHIKDGIVYWCNNITDVNFLEFISKLFKDSNNQYLFNKAHRIKYFFERNTKVFNYLSCEFLNAYRFAFTKLDI